MTYNRTKESKESYWDRVEEASMLEPQFTRAKERVGDSLKHEFCFERLMIARALGFLEQQYH